jgi:hypothetical protein
MNLSFTTGRAQYAYSAPVKNERQHNENAPCLFSCLETESNEPPPPAQILGVKRRGAKGVSATVEVEMALEAERGKDSRFWRLALKTYYSDGGVNSQVARSTEALARNPELTVPTLSPRDGWSPIAGFQVEMTVNFADVTLMMTYEEFVMPRPDDDKHQRVTELIEIRPRVVILDARPAGEPSSTQRFIEVKWDACAPDPAMISRFDICLDVAHADGLTRRVRQCVDAKSRRALIGVEPHGAAIARIGVGLSATVAWSGSSATAAFEYF